MSMSYAVDSLSLVDGVLVRNDGKKMSLTKHSDGYDIVLHGKYQNTYHRIVYWLSTGEDPNYIDHIDGNPENNAIENLRPCNQSQNNANTGINKANTSGYKGVTWNKSCGKWHAQIKDNKKRVYLGVYDDIKDAAKAYDDAAVRIYGEFAKTNKMLGLL